MNSSTLSKHDISEAKDKPLLTRPSIMDLDLLNPVARQNFIERMREYERQQKEIAFNKNLQTPLQTSHTTTTKRDTMETPLLTSYNKSANQSEVPEVSLPASVMKRVTFALPSSSPAVFKLDAIPESDYSQEREKVTKNLKRFETPSRAGLNVKKAIPNSNPKKPTLTHNSNTRLNNNKDFKPLRNLDFAEAECRPSSVARPSIMNVDLLNPVARQNFITNMNKYGHERNTIAFNETPRTSHTTVTKPEVKETPVVKKPSIMDVDLLNPIARANYLAQKREFENSARKATNFYQ